VELAAVVVVNDNQDFALSQSRARRACGYSRWSYSSRMPILGNDLLHSWMDRIRMLGVKHLWLTSIVGDENRPYSVLAKIAREGIERFLMIKLKSYAEMDLPDLLRFHCENRNSVTEAHDAQGRLGVSLLDQLALPLIEKAPESSGTTADSGRTPYSFRGYAKRVLSARERQELVGDGLTGACAMQPIGTQVREQVWVGEDVEIADSVRFAGPAYIGARSIIRAGATIGPFVSVESDCVVDCGTTIERSTILPHTYLAPGLLIRDSLVDGGFLEHLRFGAVADLNPGRLGRRIGHAHRLTREFLATANNNLSSACASPESVGTAASSELWRQVQL
jgi:carbonic anhydrase/acetyltransferase-like protein (isoleucine patch superfamily)